MTAAATKQAAGPRKAVHWAILRTLATGQPAVTRPSAAEPATAEASSAAMGGANATCARAAVGLVLETLEEWGWFPELNPLPLGL